ncbi:hypothetical protein N9764_05460 [Polaribacter sp.]|nr:hypothetical protein [Polaribacter sp.]|tara:strand:+ start:2081 stop:2659 length:579 start_codon:yes stop_codon:yes gene_type:complete
MHKLCLHRIKAPSPEFACEKANELLNSEQFSKKTIKNIKKTSLFKDNFFGDIDFCLGVILQAEAFSIKEDMKVQLIELGFTKSADEVEKLFEISSSQQGQGNQFHYSIIGCLSKNNQSYINGDSTNYKWNVSDFSIEGLNKSYQKELGNFNVLKDLNEIEPDESDDSISLWELNYQEEKGETYLIFSDIKID